MNVWLFEDSGTAYNHTQCCDGIKHGDILVIKNENLVGILYEAWPVCISQPKDTMRTALHYIEQGTYWDWGCVQGFAYKEKFYNLLPNYLKAQEIKESLPNIPVTVRRDFYYGGDY